jgi:hypothetical protein
MVEAGNSSHRGMSNPGRVSHPHRQGSARIVRKSSRPGLLAVAGARAVPGRDMNLERLRHSGPWGPPPGDQGPARSPKLLDASHCGFRSVVCPDGSRIQSSLLMMSPNGKVSRWAARTSLWSGERPNRSPAWWCRAGTDRRPEQYETRSVRGSLSGTEQRGSNASRRVGQPSAESGQATGLHEGLRKNNRNPTVRTSSEPLLGIYHAGEHIRRFHRPPRPRARISDPVG